MKAYPLIYSRTKHFDFVPDFLTRPIDFDFVDGQKYIKSVMTNLDLRENFRYSVFPVSKGYVCIGIAHLSKKIFQIIQETYPEQLPIDAQDYLRDIKGRNIACFMGIAVPVSEIKNDRVPDISVAEFFDIYIEYLSHQWNSETETKSEQLAAPPLTIKEKNYDRSFVPETEDIGGKKAVKGFERDRDKILSYYFRKAAEDSGTAFISEIKDRSEWNGLTFSSAEVDPVLIQALKAPKLVKSSDNDVDDEISIKRSPSHHPDPAIRKTPQSPELAQKKTEKSRGMSPFLIVLGIIAAVVVLIILLK